MVSNRLHLLAVALAVMSKYAIDRAPIATAFLQNTGFNYQLAVNRTPVAGIDIVAPGATVIAAGGVTNVHQAPPSADGIATRDEYWSLIRQGAADVADNVAAALATFGCIQFGLTAGRDSTVIYAALIALGRQNDVRIHTSPRDNDNPVATGLARRFGGTYGRQQATSIVSISGLHLR